MKYFLNKITGEIIAEKTRHSAMKYFKADGKRFGYKVTNKDVLGSDGILEAIANYLMEHAPADGNA